MHSLSYAQFIIQDSLNLHIFHNLIQLVFRDGGVAVVLQLIFAAFRVTGFIVGILVRVVVRQRHLSELLLRGEWLSARLEVLQTKLIKMNLKMPQLTGLEESSTSETKWKPR